MNELRDEAIEIVKIYQDKGYDVIRVVDHQYEAREYWNIFDGNDGETLKGRITYRGDRGVLVTWHDEMYAN